MYHYTSIGKGKIKNSDNIKCRWGCIETGSFVHCWGACKMVEPHMERAQPFLTNVNMHLLYELAIILLDIYHREMRTYIHIVHAYIHTYIHAYEYMHI